MSEWFEVKNVAVFDEHYDPTRQGPLQRVTRPLLEEIARNSQRRIDDTGDECPVTIGHTPRGGKGPQPPVVGFAKNFRVGTLGKINPRAAIYCDYRFPEAARQDLFWGGDPKYPKFPRRSVEIWPTDKIIDPIALLGGETPRRDLGIMAYSRAVPSSDTPVRYAMADTDTDNDMDMPAADAPDEPEEGDDDMGFDMGDLVKQVMAALAETPAFQYLAKKMQEEQQANMQAQQAAQAGQPAMQPPAAQPPAPPNGNGAPPSNGNGAPPQQQFARGQEQIRMERDELAMKLSRLEQELQVEKNSRVASERKSRRAERERQLSELQSQGYDFKRSEELDYVDPMTDEQFSSHVSRIKSYYRRSPVGVRIETGRIQDGGDDVAMQFSREDNEAVQELMRSEKLTYQDARAKHLAGKK